MTFGKVYQRFTEGYKNIKVVLLQKDFENNPKLMKITDDSFYKIIDKGESFSKGDQLKVNLQVNQIFDESVGTYVNQSFQVSRVIKHIKRDEQSELPFDKKIGNDNDKE